MKFVRLASGILLASALCMGSSLAVADTAASDAAGNGAQSCPYAQFFGSHMGMQGLGQGAGAFFTDANGDGICDNIGAGIGAFFRGGKGMGIAKTGTPQGFVDANGDGVCDNMGQGLHAGQQYRGGQGKGKGAAQ
ncbi:MAG: hypothetical protein IKE43_01900 [Coriobacteriales bacterium]|nr:hypothetical protein [Coriobacteriales bacterium]